MCCRASGSATASPLRRIVDEWNNIGCVGSPSFDGAASRCFRPNKSRTSLHRSAGFPATYRRPPMSIVSVAQSRTSSASPNFATALGAAVTAELRAGRRHVSFRRSGGITSSRSTPLNVARQLLVALRSMPSDLARADSGFRCAAALAFSASAPLALRTTRRAWSELFEQYVFGDEAAATAHIPQERHGMLGTLSAPQSAALRAQLIKRLSR